MKRLKTLTTYAAHHRLLAECGARTFWLPRKLCPVKTPFSSGPTVAVLPHSGRLVWVAETSHRRYEVWNIPENLVFRTNAEAEAEQFKQAVTV